MEAGSIWEISVFSSQFCYEPIVALKKIKSFKYIYIYTHTYVYIYIHIHIIYIYITYILSSHWSFLFKLRAIKYLLKLTSLSSFLSC